MKQGLFPIFKIKFHDFHDIFRNFFMTFVSLLLGGGTYFAKIEMA